MSIRKMVFMVLVIGILFFISSPLAHAAAATEEGLLKRIEKLEKRVVELETRLAEKEVAIKKEKVPADVDERLSQLEEKTKIVDFLKGIEVHGFVDTSYILNFDTPTSPNTRTNSLRVFDTEANGFMLNLAEINIEKPISQESPLGFRVDIDFGDDAEVFGAAGLGSTTNEVDLQQAYVQLYVPYEIPFMKDLNLRAGKYVTLHGAEVIEAVDNWNFSRSYLFGYAIPFTHTGVRANFRPFDFWDTTAYIGLVNGWDNVTDNNRGKTIESQIAISPFENFFLSVADIFGPEQASNSSNYRNVIDVVAKYDVTNRLSLMANYDFGYEDDGAGVGDDAWWSGIAGYAKYNLFDWWSVAGRFEFFRDRDGVRTGVSTSRGVTNLKVWEMTFTNEFRIFKNLLGRLEYRFDHANNDVYNNDSSVSDYQNTFAAEAIYRF